MGRTLRVGILGGSFNPVHFGHIQLAHTAYEVLDLDEVLLVPAALNPLKSAGQLAPAHHRLRMLELALPYFPPRTRLLDWELRRPPPSYTVDTVRQLRELESYHHADLYLVMGSDTALELERWKEPQELARMVKLAVFHRQGVPASGEEIAELARRLGFELHYFEARIIEVSASELRQRHDFTEVGGHLLPTPVANYIEEHGLYLSGEK